MLPSGSFGAPAQYDDGNSVMSTNIPDSGGIPSSDFTFGSVISNLWGGLKPTVELGLQTWGQVQVTQIQADAQAKLNAMKAQNATLGPNQPGAAQAEANKTLAQKWLPSAFTDGTGGSVLGLVVMALGVLLLVLVVRRLWK